MSFKLTKVQDKELDALLDELNEKRGELGAAITAFNDLIREERSKIEDALSAYNDALVGVEQFRDEFVNEMRDAWNDKSERWQEGDSGEAANDFITVWEEVDLSEVSLDIPDEIECDEPTHGEEITQLPRSV